jgi:hypothetical protein
MAPRLVDGLPMEVIGRKEFVNFPEWHVNDVPAKIDTGARNCALDALHYEIREVQGTLIAEIRVDRKRKRAATIYAPLVGMVTVTNPNGASERRPVLETVIELGRTQRRVRLSLTNRSGMRFPLILGRAALAGLFMVDVSRAYLLGRRSKSRN